MSIQILSTFIYFEFLVVSLPAASGTALPFQAQGWLFSQCPHDMTVIVSVVFLGVQSAVLTALGTQTRKSKTQSELQGLHTRRIINHLKLSS